ncbi:MAG: head GIN domain-containing protein [bacterium]|nr:head GIN domain-containing protein [bacterium]
MGTLTTGAFAQKVKGNGNIIKETKTVSPFTSIKMEGVLNVFLSQGTSENIIVEADQNLMSYIETYVIGSQLVINTKEEVEIKSSTKMNVYVTLVDINSIEISGVGNMITDSKLKLGNLTLVSSGVGDVVLNLDCSNLKADINSVGNVELTGTVRNVEIDNNGVGNVKAFDLMANVLKIQNNGVGNAEVNSAGEIYIDLNGIGNVSYKGDAIVKMLNVNGMGKVKKL